MRSKRWGPVAALAAGLLVAASGTTWAQEAEKDEAKEAEKDLDPTEVVEAYEARLNPAYAQSLSAGPSARVEWKKQRNGEQVLEVRIRNLADFYEGRDRWEVDLVVNGRSVREIAIYNGRGRLKLESRKGDIVPEVVNGDQVELRWRGDPVMRGAFRRG